MDYYNILGVTKTASQADIKKAYRKASMRWHPDRPDGDDRKFREINEAYDTLGDPEKRHAYDNPTPQFRFDTGGFRTTNNPFADFMNGFRPTHQRNRDITINLTLTIHDVLSGKDLTTRYKVPSGRIKEADITIPPGVANGTGIKFRGLGDDGHNMLPPGDLIVKIKIVEDPIWKRDGNNLVIKVYCSIFDCLLGGEVKIKTLEGRALSIKIPKGTQTDAKFSIPNQGIPNVRNGQRGSIIVQLKPVVPNIEHINILHDLENIKNALDNIT